MNAYADLRGALETLDPMAREHLRNVLIHDHAPRRDRLATAPAIATGEATTGPTSSTC
jgi:hypothetical protein